MSQLFCQPVCELRRLHAVHVDILIHVVLFASYCFFRWAIPASKSEAARLHSFRCGRIRVSPPAKDAACRIGLGHSGSLTAKGRGREGMS